MAFSDDAPPQRRDMLPYASASSRMLQPIGGGDPPDLPDPPIQEPGVAISWAEEADGPNEDLAPPVQWPPTPGPEPWRLPPASEESRPPRAVPSQVATPPSAAEPPEIVRPAAERRVPLILNSGSTAVASDGLLMRLARHYQLDIFGGSPLLVGPASTQMGYAALALTVVALFEFSAWTLLFNTVFNAGAWKLYLPTLLAAGFAGSLVAAIIMIFEITFVTLDSSSTRSLVLGGSVRVLLILLSAFVTAQPVEILLFHQDIEKRLHEEAVLEEAVVQLRRFEREIVNSGAVTQGEVAAELAGGLEEAEYSAHRKSLSDLREEGERLAREKARLEESVASAKGKVTRYQAECSSAPTEEARAVACGRIAYWRGEKVKAEASLQSKAREIEGNDGARTVAEREASAARKTYEDKVAAGMTELDAEREESEQNLDAILQWINVVRVFPPPAEPGERPGGGVWAVPAAGLTERLTVIEDLKACVPPSWPAGMEKPRAFDKKLEERLAANVMSRRGDPRLAEWYQLRKEETTSAPKYAAAQLFALPTYEDAAGSPSCPPELQALAPVMRAKYYAGLAIALFLPAVSILCKLMFGWLKHYYNVDEQAGMGNAAACNLREARRAAEENARRSRGSDREQRR